MDCFRGMWATDYSTGSLLSAWGGRMRVNPNLHQKQRAPPTFSNKEYRLWPMWSRLAERGCVCVCVCVCVCGVTECPVTNLSYVNRGCQGQSKAGTNEDLCSCL